jgi:hypothetical protein
MVRRLWPRCTPALCDESRLTVVDAAACWLGRLHIVSVLHQQLPPGTFLFFFRGGVLISPGMRFSASRERLVRFRPRVLTPHYRFGHCSMPPPLC